MDVNKILVKKTMRARIVCEAYIHSMRRSNKSRSLEVTRQLRQTKADAKILACLRTVTSSLKKVFAL